MNIDKASLLHIDCMEYMSGLPDKAFDLAIVDPPYGINIAKEKPRDSGRWNYIPKKWDSAVPDDRYFSELKRVSGHQIIWGGNYFSCLGASRGYCIWDKDQPVDNFADSEYAWTSFDRVAKTFRYPVINQNFGSDKKIHPTQKPVKLYEWLLTNYAKPGQRILDTHLGSGSSAIACNNLGFEMVGCELDADYYQAACKRVEQATKQIRMFA